MKNYVNEVMWYQPSRKRAGANLLLLLLAFLFLALTGVGYFLFSTYHKATFTVFITDMDTSELLQIYEVQEGSDLSVSIAGKNGYELLNVLLDEKSYVVASDKPVVAVSNIISNRYIKVKFKSE